MPEIEAAARADRPAVRHGDAPTPRRPVLASGVPTGAAAPAGAASTAYGTTSALPFRAVSGPPGGHGVVMVRPCAIAREQRRKSRPRLESPCAPQGMAVIR
ncbi:hypothetical protein ACFV27_17305 [Streptomyces antimycoticus]|uniref:hypothetical protein n=1 Tax=Streptomyces antimycoticus TaxID=68175 RepID=UPI003689C2AE